METISRLGNISRKARNWFRERLTRKSFSPPMSVMNSADPLMLNFRLSACWHENGTVIKTRRLEHCRLIVPSIISWIWERGRDRTFFFWNIPKIFQTSFGVKVIAQQNCKPNLCLKTVSAGWQCPPPCRLSSPRAWSFCWAAQHCQSLLVCRRDKGKWTKGNELILMIYDFVTCPLMISRMILGHWQSYQARD